MFIVLANVVMVKMIPKTHVGQKWRAQASRSDSTKGMMVSIQRALTESSQSTKNGCGLGKSIAGVRGPGQYLG
jgi:hypothetical protein